MIDNSNFRRPTTDDRRLNCDRRLRNEVFIEIKGLTHVYGRGGPGERKALSGIDLKIYRSEFVALVGPNGSGKSTLARHLNALLLPGSGQVLVDGLDTGIDEHRWEIRKKVGFVFQNPDNQIVSALVEEDVAFGPENLGLPPEEVRRRVDDALFITGLTAERMRPPHLLSGGQKQRLALAGVLAMRPECLVLDEPTAMLDPAGRRALLETLRRLNREEGLTLVLVTHFMEEAALADRILVLEGGRIAAAGPPREVFSREDLVEALQLELPAAAWLARRLRRRGFSVPAGIVTDDELVQYLCRR
ncbi:MAG: energy-coupling factor transporter ATPase [Firmicutes bacterium]|nr:energy-coupling factor transporter ATPase [Bacillota bacterium]